MLSIDHLYNLAMILREDPELRSNVFQAFECIIDDSEYRHWIDEEQFEEGSFIVPYEWPGEPRLKHLLEQRGLIDSDELQVKVERHGNALCLTDGLWMPPRYRVFPFTDESERLMEYLNQNALVDWPDVLVDPASGCGHHSLYLSNVTNRISLDLSIRANAYCVLNKYLNGQATNRNFFVGANDIKLGIPNTISMGLFGRVLFTVNMPFAISPMHRDGDQTLPLSADGGEMGADLTLAALRAIREASSKMPSQEVRACILNYSVGLSADGPWLIEDRARELFPDAEIRYTVLTDEKMWRVNGKKEQSNPMPVTLLRTKAECRYYVSDDKREQTRIGYTQRELQLKRAGWNFLCYGMLDIRLK